MLNHKIDKFRVDLYTKYFSELVVDYKTLINEFSDFVEMRFYNDEAIMELREELMIESNRVLETGDLVRMSDHLTGSIRPIICDIMEMNDEEKLK